MQQWKEPHYIPQFMELLKGLEKNWIYVCSRFLFQVICETFRTFVQVCVNQGCVTLKDDVTNR